MSSLLLALRAFGENNVQTAKHYGNLGRLYQSMHKFAVSLLLLHFSVIIIIIIIIVVINVVVPYLQQ